MPRPPRLPLLLLEDFDELLFEELLFEELLFDEELFEGVLGFEDDAAGFEDELRAGAEYDGALLLLVGALYDPRLELGFGEDEA